MACRQYAEEKCEAVSNDFISRGFMLGGYDSLGALFVWVAKPDEVVVWDQSMQLVNAKNGIIRFFPDRTLAVETIEAFVAYADDNYIDRGVNARLKSGQEVNVLYHLSMGASNPTYNRNDLLMDSAWCDIIARALADWGHVRYIDKI